MTAAPTTEPTTIIAGDTLKWSRTDLSSQYPAPAWTLSYALRGPSRIDLTAAPDGERAHQVTVPAADTAAYTPGEYTWAAFVTNAATAERYQVDTGRVIIAPNLAADTAVPYDGRSYSRRMLDAIESVLLNRASEDANELTINGKRLVRMTPAELLTLRDKFRLQAANERKAERLRKGLSSGNRILLRFK